MNAEIESCKIDGGRGLARIGLFFVLAWMVLATLGGFTSAATGDEPSNQSSSPDTAESQKGTTQLPEIVVEERSDSMLGVADTSTAGTIGAQQLEDRPVSRPGEVLEAMPGVIVTQHSGDGKANQYFLRGFNLDHGTDLASFFDGIPINLPSNAHGEGYTDLNFLIPELIQRIDYGKGPYYANVGDFGSAGWENIRYVQTLPEGIAKVEVGSWNYERALFADSTKLGLGNLLGALEVAHTDGPWDVPENYLKFNGVLTYSQGDTSQGFSATALGYHGTWNATNQIPQLAVAEGLIDRFGSLNPSDGGLTDRYTVSAEYHQADENSATKIMGYSYYYKMGLWNDFTFFLDDPVHGDQFEQSDSRWVQGLRASQTYFGQLCNMRMENTFGLDIRNDVISDGLFHTKDQVVLATTRTDDVVETDVAPYFENKIQWLSWFRTVIGFREDTINFNNKNTFTFFTNGPNPADSGDRLRSTPEPKLSLIFGPWAKTEFYLNGGMGFHTDDARGANTTEDPKTGLPVDRALPIAQTEGAEVGVRTLAVPNLQSTLTAWVLRLQSELVFDGDIGTNVPSPDPSIRMGLEWANYYTPTKWLTIDADFATSQAHFEGNPVGGDHVPEAANVVIASGITVHDLKGWHSSLRWRYFGPRYLTQDGSERSPATSLLYYNIGYQINKRWSIEGDIFNLLNSKADDIDYFYTYRLQGEPAAGVSGDVFHPAEPRTFRVALIMRF
ncbi:MAG: TonB-dependent receptor [Syntrophobacteraceae bacterium]